MSQYITPEVDVIIFKILIFTRVIPLPKYSDVTHRMCKTGKMLATAVA